ncbi:MAG: hypothetical protein ACFFFD_12975 [Promethearchaeota archaeon]
MESLIKHYPSLYSDLVLDGNRLIWGIIVSEVKPYTITIIFRIGKSTSLYNFTIIVSGGYSKSEVSRMEADAKDFIESHIEFLKRRDTMIWPCGRCGESYAYPVLSADGRYRCPKCASPVDGSVIQ